MQIYITIILYLLGSHYSPCLQLLLWLSDPSFNYIGMENKFTNISSVIFEISILFFLREPRHIEIENQVRLLKDIGHRVLS